VGNFCGCFDSLSLDNSQSIFPCICRHSGYLNQIGYRYEPLSTVPHSKVDLGKPILESQDRLARLKTAAFWVTRIQFLQLPVWTILTWNTEMFNNENAGLVNLQGIATLSSVYLVIWLFLNINYENLDNKGVRRFFNGKEWDPSIKSMELLHQIEEFMSSCYPKNSQS
jgi:hypothetical protein